MRIRGTETRSRYETERLRRSAGKSMATLVEKVVELEARAGEVIARAGSQAGLIEGSLGDEVEAFRLGLLSEMERRAAAFQHDAEARFERAMEEVSKGLQGALEAVDRIPEDRIRRMVDRIVSMIERP